MKTFGGTQAYRWSMHRCPKQFRLWHEGAPDTAPSLLQRLFFTRGDALERRFVEQVRGDEPSHVDIRRERFGDRTSATLKAMRDGVNLIIHPRLVVQQTFGLEEIGVQLGGEADLFRRLPGERLPSGFYPYEPIEIKSSSGLREHQRMQLALYCTELSHVQRAPVTQGIVVTWQREGNDLVPVEHTVDVEPQQQELDELLRVDLPAFVKQSAPAYHVLSACDSCPYHRNCRADAVREEHPSVLPNIRRSHRYELLDAGVTRWTQLAVSQREFESIETRWNGTGPTLRKLRTQALAHWYDSAFPIGDIAEEIAESASWKLAVGETSGARVYFDLESDAIDGHIYLFGVLVEAYRSIPRSLTRGMSEDERFEAALDAFCSRRGTLHGPIQTIGGPGDERRLFEDFLALMDRLREECERISILHFGRFEIDQLKALAKRHASIKNVHERVSRLLGECVNIYDVVKATRVLPVESYSLKNIAPTLSRVTQGKHGRNWTGPRDRRGLWEFLLKHGYSGTDAVDNLAVVERTARAWKVSLNEFISPSAGNSVAWYREFVRDNAPVWPSLLKAYNADDLFATRAVLEWLVDELPPAVNRQGSSVQPRLS